MYRRIYRNTPALLISLVFTLFSLSEGQRPARAAGSSIYYPENVDVAATLLGPRFVKRLLSLEAGQTWVEVGGGTNDLVHHYYSGTLNDISYVRGVLDGAQIETLPPPVAHAIVIGLEPPITELLQRRWFMSKRYAARLRIAAHHEADLRSLAPNGQYRRYFRTSLDKLSAEQVRPGSVSLVSDARAAFGLYAAPDRSLRKALTLLEEGGTYFTHQGYNTFILGQGVELPLPQILHAATLLGPAGQQVLRRMPSHVQHALQGHAAQELNAVLARLDLRNEFQEWVATVQGATVYVESLDGGSTKPWRDTSHEPYRRIEFTRSDSAIDVEALEPVGVELPGHPPLRIYRRTGRFLRGGGQQRR